MLVATKVRFVDRMAYSARNALQPAVVGFHINRLYSASNGLVTDWIHPLAEAIHFLGKGFDRLCWQPFFALDDFSNCGVSPLAGL